MKPRQSFQARGRGH